MVRAKSTRVKSAQQIRSLAVLGGELAVPCYPQSATAGLNSLPEAFFFGRFLRASGVDGQDLRNQGS